jgi:hypothetical protein
MEKRFERVALFLLIGILIGVGGIFVVQGQSVSTVWHPLQDIAKSPVNLLSVDANGNELIDGADSATVVTDTAFCSHENGCQNGLYGCRLIYDSGANPGRQKLEKPVECRNMAVGFWVPPFERPPTNIPQGEGTSSVLRSGYCDLMFQVWTNPGATQQAVDVFNGVYSHAGKASSSSGLVRWSLLLDHTSVSSSPVRSEGSYVNVLSSGVAGNLMATFTSGGINLYDTYGSGGGIGAWSDFPEVVDHWVVDDTDPGSVLHVLVC